MSVGACGVIRPGGSTARSPASHAASPRAQIPHQANHQAALRSTRTASRVAGPPPLVPPTAAHPLTILVIGDSLGEDLGYGLQDLLGAQPAVRVVMAAVGSTGLANRAYYNWPAALVPLLVRNRPGVVVALFGGNDAVGFDQGGHPVPFGSARWQRDYGARVATVMREATAAGAHVLWVGLPIMAPSSVLPNAAIRALNAVYRAEARVHPGVAYVSTWSLFQAPQGGYTPVLVTRRGVPEVVRDPDGVHIAPPAGDELLASYVVAALDRADGLRICPSAGDLWHRFDPPGCDPPASSPPVTPGAAR
ncbi:MAG: DUF459 domain-containing protein [Actinomycetia bacterium]|nr:DUF459 domain-containing protein [Actinomycetes bacterium]